MCPEIRLVCKTVAIVIDPVTKLRFGIHRGDFHQRPSRTILDAWEALPTTYSKVRAVVEKLGAEIVIDLTIAVVIAPVADLGGGWEYGDAGRHPVLARNSSRAAVSAKDTLAIGNIPHKGVFVCLSITVVIEPVANLARRWNGADTNRLSAITAHHGPRSAFAYAADPRDCGFHINPTRLPGWTVRRQNRIARPAPAHEDQHERGTKPPADHRDTPGTGGAPDASPRRTPMLRQTGGSATASQDIAINASEQTPASDAVIPTISEQAVTMMAAQDS
jgi:hypothetical protein